MSPGHRRAGEAERGSDECDGTAWAIAIDQASNEWCRKNAEQRTNAVEHHHLLARDIEVDRNMDDESGDADGLAGRGHENADRAGTGFAPASGPAAVLDLISASKSSL